MLVYAYENTKDMRCPDNSYYVQKFIEVAESYNSAFTCVQAREGQIIKAAKERIKKKIQSLAHTN